MKNSLQSNFNELNPSLTADHLYQMHDAARTGQAWLLETLIKMGMAVDAPTRWGNTPLLVAAEAGQADCVRVLIAHNANLNATNRTTHTPLMLAERAGNKECATLLRNAGADTNIKTFYGYKAADLATDKPAAVAKASWPAKKLPGIFRF